MKEKIGRGRALAWVIIAVSVGMMAYGWSQGEANVVLHKAIRICMECIGIG